MDIRINMVASTQEIADRFAATLIERGWATMTTYSDVRMKMMRAGARKDQAVIEMSIVSHSLYRDRIEALAEGPIYRDDIFHIDTVNIEVVHHWSEDETQ